MTWRRRQHQHAARRPLAALVGALVAVALTAAPASAGVGPAHSEHHCVSPTGHDLNDIHDTPYQIATEFCPVVVGEPWALTSLWITATDHSRIPPGYVPSQPTPIEDFVAKVAGVRYVIDAGTRQERTYTRTAAEVLQPRDLPDIGLPTMGIFSLFRPLSVGSHTVDMFVTMSADHWDGIDLDPGGNLLPAGEIHWLARSFEFVRPTR